MFDGVDAVVPVSLLLRVPVRVRVPVLMSPPAAWFLCGWWEGRGGGLQTGDGR